jgi:hypothetical protein
VQEPTIIQGRQIGPEQLAQVRQLLGAHPDWSRSQLSRQLARLWDWRNPAGQLKDMAARTLLRKLAGRGWIELPLRQESLLRRLSQRPLPPPPAPVSTAPVTGPLAALRPLAIAEVSSGAQRPQRALFTHLLRQHHYLSYGRPVGENLQYLVGDNRQRPLACVLFGAAAWQCAARDRYIGWDAPQRAQHLQLVANNSRCLILPWVRVPHLASYILSRLGRRLSRDWQTKYGHPIWLLETFVQTHRFAGTAYRAANWVRVGQTKGRSRQDRPDGTWNQVPVKDVYLLPLHPCFRQWLQGGSAHPLNS